jgi:hypothetical protein
MSEGKIFISGPISLNLISICSPHGDEKEYVISMSFLLRWQIKISTPHENFKVQSLEIFSPFNLY